MEHQVKIAVLFGGNSMERDVSVASAAQVVDALPKRAVGCPFQMDEAKSIGIGIKNRGTADQLAGAVSDMARNFVLAILILALIMAAI